MTEDLTVQSNLIKNLQEMIRYLSIANDDIETRVNVSGVYDAKTERAVRKYQREKGSQETGNVDLETWNYIRDEYAREKKRRDDIFILPIPRDAFYETRVGERSDTVAILQIILSALRLFYEYPEVPLSGIYGPQTERAIREFQGANGLTKTGVADRNTWRRLSEEYNALPNQ